MDKAALREHLEGLANGSEDGNAPVVRAYLEDEGAHSVARLLTSATYPCTLNKSPLFLPSSCLPLLT